MDELQPLIRRYMIGIWRKRWLALGMAWLICVGGWIGVSMIPNQYESSARLYVDSDAVLTPLLKGLALDNTPASQLEILQRTLLSRPNLEKLISKTDLELGVTGPADLERAVQTLAANIRVVPQTKNLFTIVYRNDNPKLAYDVVQSILTIFIESKTGTNRADMENARIFMQQQIASYEQKLREAETRRAEFRTKNADLLPNEQTGAASRFDQARASVTTLTGRLEDLTLQRDLLKAQLAATPATLSPAEAAASGGGGGGGGNSAVAAAERGLEELRSRYTDQHPEVIAMKRRIEFLRANPGPSAGGGRAAAPAARAPNGGIPNPVAEQIKTRLFDLDSSIVSTQRQLTDATSERDRLDEQARARPSLQAEYVAMSRDYDVLKKNYESLLERREAMRLAAAADTDAEKVKLQIIDPPQIPQNPVAPKRILLVSAVLGAGLAGGLALAVLLLQFDRSFHGIEDLRSLGLPVMGGISLLAAAMPLPRRILQIGSFAVCLLLLGVVYGGLLVRLLRLPGVA